jgi:hypothetical protein
LLHQGIRCFIKLDIAGLSFIFFYVTIGILIIPVIWNLSSFRSWKLKKQRVFSTAFLRKPPTALTVRQNFGLKYIVFLVRTGITRQDYARLKETFPLAWTIFQHAFSSQNVEKYRLVLNLEQCHRNSVISNSGRRSLVTEAT